MITFRIRGVAFSIEAIAYSPEIERAKPAKSEPSQIEQIDDGKSDGTKETDRGAMSQPYGPISGQVSSNYCCIVGVIQYPSDYQLY